MSAIPDAIAPGDEPNDSQLALAIFDDYPDGLLVVQPQSLRVLSANRVACETLQYSAAELTQLVITAVESSIENLFYWDDARNGYYSAMELRDGYYQRRDGSVIAVQKRISVLQTPAGALLLVTFTETPATDQQDEFIHSSSLLAATLEATADGILVTRLDGSISNLNRRFAQMWRIPEAVMDAGVDGKIFAFLEKQAADEAQYKQQLAAAIQNSDSDTLDTVHLHDGRIFERYTTPLQTAGSLAGYVFSFRDVTERKQHEATLRTKNAELEKANRVKSEFLANMSHEIRTPMNAIIGLSRLCLGTELTAQQRDYVQKLYHSAQSLLGLINDILDFSKIEAGKLTMEAIPFQLGKVFERIQHLTALSAQEKDLTLTFEMQFPPKYAGLDGELVGDPLRVGQVLLNLVSNAIKFTEHGAVRVRVMPNRVDDEYAELCFTVQDTGIGMTKDQCARLFNSFSQADASTTRKYGGTGLGLAICKTLTELMHGSISVTSTPDVGTTFTFTARFGRCVDGPAHGDTAAGQGWKIPTLSEIRGARVLVVEDNRINQQIARELLTQAGLAPVIAHNGLEGVALIEAAPFDAVLMDLQMPVMDGFEATTIVRNKSRFAALPIIAMTANAMAGDAQRCIEAGMNDHVPKPIDPEQLFQTLRKWIKPGQRDGAARPASISEATQQVDSALAIRIPQLDLDHAQQLLGGNRALLRSLLLLFWRDHREDLNVLRATLAAGDRKSAERIAHTLKGIAGSIGARDLEAVAKRVEAPLREGKDPSPDVLAELAAAFNPVIMGLAMFAKNETNAAPASEGTASADKRLPRVLLVDDEPMIVTVLTAVLKSQYAIISAHSGEEAIAASISEQPDLILMDVNMPDMDGFDTCAALKADPRCRTIPLVFVTGSDDAADRERGLSLGAVDFLTKPIKADAVKNCVGKHIAAK